MYNIDRVSERPSIADRDSRCMCLTIPLCMIESYRFKDFHLTSFSPTCHINDTSAQVVTGNAVFTFLYFSCPQCLENVGPSKAKYFCPMTAKLQTSTASVPMS